MANRIFATHRSSDTYQNLSAAHPASDVRLASAHTSEQADAVVRGKLQAGLVIIPVREGGRVCEGLYRQALLLALPEHHPLMEKAAIEITDLDKLPLVYYPINSWH